MRKFCLILILLLAAPGPALAGEPTAAYELVASYPHDPNAFTQGLLYFDGLLYESTGLYGHSTLRKVELASGEVLELRSLPAHYFGEGLALFQDQLIQLTWREGEAFIYSLDTLEQEDNFTYETEGWGLTTDGEFLIMSDGSAKLTFLDPVTYQPVRSITVRGARGEVRFLNELEYVAGEVWANVWGENLICRINPQTGTVLGWIDLTELQVKESRENPGLDVLNGIAFDPETGRIFVTGKLWSRIYEIRLQQEF